MLSQVFESHLWSINQIIYLPWLGGCFSLPTRGWWSKYIMSYHWQPIRLPSLPLFLCKWWLCPSLWKSLALHITPQSKIVFPLLLNMSTDTLAGLTAFTGKAWSISSLFFFFFLYFSCWLCTGFHVSQHIVTTAGPRISFLLVNLTAWPLYKCGRIVPQTTQLIQSLMKDRPDGFQFMLGDYSSWLVIKIPGSCWRHAYVRA